MKFALHKNDNGSFQELAHADDVKFGQLSWLTINPNCKRGGHFHIKKREWFVCITGKCDMELVNVKDGSIRHIEMSDNDKEFVLVEPYESHTLTNTGDTVCGLNVIVSSTYDPKKADTFKFEV
jgi:UDP-2-acetamido-2,6-beta-L-arabino-hexul-4-ose reductase